MAKNIKTKKGFTIIEVVLVLAIAGLIFLMVFVALPQLRSSQRDTQRRQDMSRVVTALVQYQTNNRTKRNNLPPAGTVTFNASTSDTESDFGESCKSSACLFIKNYMNASGATTDTFNDPDGVPYNMTITENVAVASDGINAALGTSSGSSTSGGTSEGGEGSETVLSKLELGAGGGITVGGSDPIKDHRIYVIPGGQCSGEEVIESELRQFAVLYKLEGAGVYCVGSDSN